MRPTMQAEWDRWTLAHEAMWEARREAAGAPWPERTARQARAEELARESQAAETAYWQEWRRAP